MLALNFVCWKRNTEANETLSKLMLRSRKRVPPESLKQNLFCLNKVIFAVQSGNFRELAY